MVRAQARARHRHGTHQIEIHPVRQKSEEPDDGARQVAQIGGRLQSLNDELKQKRATGSAGAGGSGSVGLTYEREY